MIRVRMRTNNQPDIFKTDADIFEAVFHMIEQVQVAGIDKNPGLSVDQVRIAIIS